MNHPLMSGIRHGTFAFLVGIAAAVAAPADASAVQKKNYAPPASPSQADLPESPRDLQVSLPDDKSDADHEAPSAVSPGRFPILPEELLKDRSTRPSDFRTTRPSNADLALLRQQAAGGPVRVIVTLKTLMTPEGQLGEAGARIQRTHIADLQDQVLQALQGAARRGAMVVHHRYRSVPQLALSVDASSLEALAASPVVARIQPEAIFDTMLDVSVPLVGGADVVDRGFQGNSWVVAVLDTGIDRNHPFLRGFVGEACFSGNGNCPNGQTTQFGSGAAASCTYAPNGCPHGTHTSGIAIGASQTGFTSLNGMARGARLMPVQVFSRFTGANQCANAGEDPCTRVASGDILAGLEYVYDQRGNFAIAAVNLSLGGSAIFADHCDDDPLKPIIDNLRDAGIATVAAAGNAGQANGLASPACISSAISVGATDDADNVAGFSNSASYLQLLAPGVNINSSLPGSTFGNLSGTSQAAPHVAGAIAMMQSQNFRPVTSVLVALQFNGKPVNDAGVPGGRVTPRIQVLEAMNLDRVVLTDAAPRNFRNPIPNAHTFSYVSDKSFWSAIAIRAESPGLDTDLRLFESSDYTGLLAQSSAAKPSIDIIAQDNNADRRAKGTDFPRVNLGSGGGTGRYSIELSNPGITLGTSLTSSLFGGEILKVFDVFAGANVTQFVRLVPNDGQDMEILAFTDNPFSPSSWVRTRQNATAFAEASQRFPSNGAIAFQQGTTGFAGIVIAQPSGPAGSFTLFHDDSAPTGSIVLNDGAATTSNRTVKLTLAATDPETGIDKMRIAADGVTFGPWQDFVSEQFARVPQDSGIATVAVQYRDKAFAVATFSDSIELVTQPEISIGDARVTEGNSGDTLATFTISLSKPATQDLFGLANTSPQTAVTPDDYAAGFNGFVIPAGQLSTTVSIAVHGDTDVEPDETFLITLRLNGDSANAVSVIRGQGVGTIVDDDGAPTLSVGDVSVKERNAGRFAKAVFTVSLSVPSPNPVSVHFATADLTAQAGSDYAARRGRVTFAPGEVARTVVIRVRGDGDVEPDEAFTLTLDHPRGGATIAAGLATATIVNDD